MKSSTKLTRSPWHPFLFAAYPVLGLLAADIGNARPAVGVRLVVMAVLGAAILFGLLRLLTRDWHRAAFATGFPWDELDHADLYLEPSPLRGGLTEFEGLVLGTTAYRIAEDKGLVNTRLTTFNRYRERTQFALDTLPTLATLDMGAPKFVFEHLILPHPPFFFAEDGSHVDSLSFLNEKNQFPRTNTPKVS
jgi:hypothetical protein